MSPSTLTPAAETAVARLSDRLFSHLAVEETALTEMRNSLQSVRSALLRHDAESLGASLAEQAQVADRLEAVVRQRAEILAEWSDAFAIPLSDLTLKRLTDWLSADAAQHLLLARERLRELAFAVQKLNRANAVLVNHSIDMTRQVLAELTPGGLGSDGYNAAGGRQEAFGGPMIEVGG